MMIFWLFLTFLLSALNVLWAVVAVEYDRSENVAKNYDVLDHPAENDNETTVPTSAHQAQMKLPEQLFFDSSSHYSDGSDINQYQSKSSVLDKKDVDNGKSIKGLNGSGNNFKIKSDTVLDNASNANNETSVNSKINCDKNCLDMQHDVLLTSLHPVNVIDASLFSSQPIKEENENVKQEELRLMQSDASVFSHHVDSDYNKDLEEVVNNTHAKEIYLQNAKIIEKVSLLQQSIDSSQTGLKISVSHLSSVPDHKVDQSGDSEKEVLPAVSNNRTVGLYNEPVSATNILNKAISSDTYSSTQGVLHSGLTQSIRNIDQPVQPVNDSGEKVASKISAIPVKYSSKINKSNKTLSDGKTISLKNASNTQLKYSLDDLKKKTSLKDLNNSDLDNVRFPSQQQPADAVDTRKDESSLLTLSDEPEASSEPENNKNNHQIIIPSSEEDSLEINQHNNSNISDAIFNNFNSSELNESLTTADGHTMKSFESESSFFSIPIIAGIAVGVLIISSVIGIVSFVVYRHRYWNKPQTLSDKCSNADSSGYIDDSTLRDNSEEMYSLDNDSFLNSLEAMTIQNYWTDNVKHTKL